MSVDYRTIIEKIFSGIDSADNYAQGLSLVDCAKAGGCTAEELLALENLMAEKGEQRNSSTPTVDPAARTFTREDVMGREFFINSTAYYHGELFIGELSRCNGATKDFSRLRFHSDLRHHANLGCIPDRARRHVLLTQADILPLLKEQLQSVTKQHPQTKDYPYLALTAREFPPSIKVEFMKKVEDPFDGRIHFQSPDLMGFMHKIQIPGEMELGKEYLLQNDSITLFDRNDLENLAYAIGESIQPYLLTPQKTRSLAALLEDATDNRIEQGRGEPSSKAGHNLNRI